VRRPRRGKFELVGLVEKVDQVFQELSSEKFTERAVRGKLLHCSGAVRDSEPVCEGCAQCSRKPNQLRAWRRVELLVAQRRLLLLGATDASTPPRTVQDCT
jgi:hypothetical protein